MEFKQNKYQFELAEDVNVSVVTKSTLKVIEKKKQKKNVQCQIQSWYSGNICFLQFS